MKRNRMYLSLAHDVLTILVLLARLVEIVSKLVGGATNYAKYIRSQIRTPRPPNLCSFPERKTAGCLDKALGKAALVEPTLLLSFS
jgi:hypothetical protein